MLSDEVIAGWRKELPQLPDVRKAAYMADYGLTAYAAEQLVSSKYLADYFETAAQSTTAVKMLANLMISEVFRLLDGEDAKIPAETGVLGEDCGHDGAEPYQRRHSEKDDRRALGHAPKTRRNTSPAWD